jgi:hypothetical protein
MKKIIEFFTFFFYYETMSNSWQRVRASIERLRVRTRIEPLSIVLPSYRKSQNRAGGIPLSSWSHGESNGIGLVKKKKNGYVR